MWVAYNIEKNIRVKNFAKLCQGAIINIVEQHVYVNRRRVLGGVYENGYGISLSQMFG